jgi:outer membrane lipoprotein-sorting protein
MYKRIVLLSVIFSGFLAKAQHAGYILLADTASFKARFAVASQNTNSFTSDFVQEKNLSMLSEKIVSKGRFWFKKENLVRMEYDQPFQYLMVLNQGKVFIKDGQKENKISTGSNKLFRQINAIMIDCVKGTALNNPDFRVRLFGNNQTFLIELSPTVKNLKELFKNILIIVDKKDYSASRIEMNELSGDNTVISFINKELNATIPDALFTIH